MLRIMKINLQWSANSEAIFIIVSYHCNLQKTDLISNINMFFHSLFQKNQKINSINL